MELIVLIASSICLLESDLIKSRLKYHCSTENGIVNKNKPTTHRSHCPKPVPAGAPLLTTYHGWLSASLQEKSELLCG